MQLENQALQQSPQITVEPQSFGGNPSAQIEPSAGLTPSMGIVPDNPTTTDNTIGNGLGLTPNMGIVPGPSNGGQPQQGGRGRGEPRVVDPRQDFLRHPDPNYRNRGPRVDDNDHDNDRDRDHDRRRRRPEPPRYNWYIPPPVVVVPQYYYNNLPPWSGPITATVVWDLFSRDVYYSLPPNARWRHEQTFNDALSAPMGRTQSWRIGDVRGDVTVIDQGYYGRRFCRDFVQTIRTPTWRRTVDGRACIVRGDSWRLADY